MEPGVRGGVGKRINELLPARLSVPRLDKDPTSEVVANRFPSNRLLEGNYKVHSKPDLSVLKKLMCGNQGSISCILQFSW